MTDRPSAIAEIREICNKLAGAITSIHPAVPALSDKPTQDEIYKALFALTKEVEVIKKQLLKLERRDASTDL
ncbi:MAG: hypothetical protein JWL90_175 [Chthoniobacteraceae bacterium]|nr:hypothetical protein [Chthoniobacteraceae bacterium]MDB6174673.1 hypothetical protein [Chthoniobacteraceae bacterium]